MKTVTYTWTERYEELRDQLLYLVPARLAPRASIRTLGWLATRARAYRLERLAARLAWWAYEVADSTRDGQEFLDVLPASLPWCYPDRENRPGWFLPVMIQD